MSECMEHPPDRLADADIGAQLQRLDDLLGQVEDTPGPAGEIAVEAVSALARIYGEALARGLAYVSGAPSLCEAFLHDELIGHLLVLHDIHPEPVHARIGRVLAELSKGAQQTGATLEFTGIEHNVATVQIATHGCGSSSAGVAEAVKKAVLGIAPELADVAVVPAPRRDKAFIPVAGLMPRPAVTSHE